MDTTIEVKGNPSNPDDNTYYYLNFIDGSQQTVSISCISKEAAEELQDAFARCASYADIL